MLLLMVYWDDSTGKKKRLEQHLRAKKIKREGSGLYQENDSSEELNKALDIIARQGKEREEKDKQIDSLVQSLQKTQSLLEESIKNNNIAQYIKPNEEKNTREKITKENIMPTLEDIDSQIAVIDTTGIEVGGGKAGESVLVNEGTESKADKLKKILQRRGK